MQWSKNISMELFQNIFIAILKNKRVEHASGTIKNKRQKNKTVFFFWSIDYKNHQLKITNN